VYETILDMGDVSSLMGIQAVYTSADGRRMERLESQPGNDESGGLPLSPPLRAVWTGFIAAPDYGEHLLGLRVPGHARILLDGQPFAEGDGTIENRAVLFQGPHRLEIEADIGETGPVQLYWQRRDATAVEPVPATELFSSPSVYWGLRASFFTGVGFEGTPAWERLDPFVAFRYGGDIDIPVSGPFSVRWQGKLMAPASGSYGLRLFTIGDGRLLIDGQQTLVTTSPSATNEGEFALTAGAHDIEVLFSNSIGSSQVVLSWRPPAGEWVEIPAQYFAPQ
jgi:hypothetical protein